MQYQSLADPEETSDLLSYFSISRFWHEWFWKWYIIMARGDGMLQVNENI